MRLIDCKSLKDAFHLFVSLLLCDTFVFSVCVDECDDSTSPKTRKKVKVMQQFSAIFHLGRNTSEIKVALHKNKKRVRKSRLFILASSMPAGWGASREVNTFDEKSRGRRKRLFNR